MDFSFLLSNLLGDLMDFFKLKTPFSGAFDIEEGEILSGITSSAWTERYRNSGDFKMVAASKSGLREALPLGTLISHTNTLEVMIVENHEIDEAAEEGKDLTITGRSFETYLENRIVGANRYWLQSSVLVSLLKVDLTRTAAYCRYHAQEIIKNSIEDGRVVVDDDIVDYIRVTTGHASDTEEVMPYELKRGSVYQNVLDLLSVDDYGIEVHRPWAGSFAPDRYKDLVIRIHYGEDLSDEVLFSYDNDEVLNGKYLWSNKPLKTAALVSGTWYQLMVYLPGANYGRRTMYVDAADVDESYAAAPTGSDRTSVEDRLKARGLSALSNQKELSIVSAQIGNNLSSYRYRSDYQIGDIVTVQGNYNSFEKKRVTEYVEIEDEDGFVGYPTLSSLPE